MSGNTKKAADVLDLISRDGVTVNASFNIKDDEDMRHYAGIASTDESGRRGGYAFEAGTFRPMLVLGGLDDDGEPGLMLSLEGRPH